MADLPSGAVTFLFTDIEGSTRLVKLLRERYGEVLQEHQRLLRAAFEAHRGYEVDTQGDSFFVAFSSARDALLAAVEGQRALSSHSWPDGVQIKVRMGLHTGQAIATGGRYTGLAVHRAARIGAAGHGGQILVSQATQTLLEDEEEDLHDPPPTTSASSGSRTSIARSASTRLRPTGYRLEFPPLRGDAELAHAAGTPIQPSSRRRRAAIAVAARRRRRSCVMAARGPRLAATPPAGWPVSVRTRVGVIDPATNEIVAEVPGRDPAGADRRRRRLDLGRKPRRPDADEDRCGSSARRVRHVSLDNQTPTGLAVGDGAVWVAHGLRGQVSRVDPQFNRVTRRHRRCDPTGSRTGAVAVGGGSVWAASSATRRSRSIDPTDARVAASALCRWQCRRRSWSGRDAVWVANSGDSTVERFNPATFEEGPVRTISVGRQANGHCLRRGSRLGREHRRRLRHADRRRLGRDAHDRRRTRADCRRGRIRSGLGRQHADGNRLAHRPGDEHGRARRSRSATLRRCGRWATASSGSPFRRPEASELLETDGRQVERGSQHDAADALRHERRLREEADRRGRRGVAGEPDVELAVRPVALATLKRAAFRISALYVRRVEPRDVRRRRRTGGRRAR